MQKNELGLYDIYDVLYVPFWRQPLFYLTIIICVGIVALLILVYWYKRRVVTQSAHQHTIKILQDIQIDQLETVEQRQQFYINAIDLLKKLLAVNYGQEIRGKTDQELAIFLSNILPDAHMQDFYAIINGAQLIKFAKQDAARNQMYSDRDRLIAIIKAVFNT